MSKPTNKPGWNPTNATEPSASKKAQGWAAGEKPAAEHFNWLMKTVSEWIEHIDAEGVQGPKGDTGPAGPAGAGSEADVALINSRLNALENASGVALLEKPTINIPDISESTPGEYDAGSVLPGNSKVIDWANGASQYLLLDADCALSMVNAVAGNTYYLRIQQGGYGGRLITSWPGGIIWNSNSVPTVPAAPWQMFGIGVYFDGTNYYADASSSAYNPPPAPIETKNGYIAGGMTGSQANVGVAALSSVEKLNLNTDTTMSVVQTMFGVGYAATGGAQVLPGLKHFYYGMGTQSATAGYQTQVAYGTALTAVTPRNPSGVNSATTRTNKLLFSNDTTVLTGFLSNYTNAVNNYAGYVTHRRGVVETLLHCYQKGTSGSSSPNYSKMDFSTEISSTLTNSVSGALIGSYGENFGGFHGAGVGFSTSEQGNIYGIATSSGNGVVGEKIAFSNDTISLGSLKGISNMFAGEGLCSGFHGYTQVATATTGAGTSSLLKVDLKVDTWATTGSIAVGASNGSAVNGSGKGYFCGGNNIAGVPVSAATTTNAVSKLVFPNDSYSVHSVTLNTGRVLAAGFEG